MVMVGGVNNVMKHVLNVQALDPINVFNVGIFPFNF